MEKNLQELIMEHEPHVSLDTANLLKQAGFDWNCQGFYKENVFYSGSIEYCSNYYYQESVYVKAPSLYVAQRWLREVKNIDINILVESISGRKQYLVSIWFNISSNSSYDNIILDNRYTTYEQALEAGIKKVLEIILEKGK